MKYDDELKKLAPTFLKNMHGDPSETCMAWGCECGDGWEKPITDLCIGIEALNDSGDYKAVADQIKEKFAELTVYWHIETPAGACMVLPDASKEFYDKVENLIKSAGDRCSELCEVCGSPATKITKGWIKHVCDKCYEQNLVRRGLDPTPDCKQ